LGLDVLPTHSCGFGVSCGMTGWGDAITVPWGMAMNIFLFDSQQQGDTGTVGDTFGCCAQKHTGGSGQQSSGANSEGCHPECVQARTPA
jgi:hypothetical protein